MSAVASPIFTVFRRSDGYVNAIARDYPVEQMVDNGSTHFTFDILLHTPEWHVARDFIAAEREKA